MPPKAPPRISWSPDDRRVLVCANNRARITDLDGTILRELEHRPITLGTAPNADPPGATRLAGYLDARWLRDGRIAAVDVFGLPLILSMQGEIQSDFGQPPNPWRVSYASISEDGENFVVVDRQIVVRGIGWSGRGGQWLYSDRNYTSIPVIDPARATAMLSHDGLQIAIGFDTEPMLAMTGTQPGSLKPAGRGWIVLDCAPRQPSYSGPREPSPIDDYWFPIDHTEAPMTFAFDPGNRRLAIASGCERGSGTIRIGIPSRAPDSVGMATATAFDHLGLRVCYVLPHAERRLHVDYLSNMHRGPRSVEITDSKAIDPGIEAVAIAFDSEGHRIACLGEDGSVEIVPVP